jgi:peptide/nickel transport system substrate-binding protein
MNSSRRLSYLISLAICLNLLVACGGQSATPVRPTPTFAQTPSPVPSPPSPRELTICLGEEPNTLYPYGDPNAAARSVLAAIYDGPIDTVSYEYQPVILERLPTLENGEAQINPVKVRAGDEVIDASGNPTRLEKGLRIRPSGCRNDGCAIRYDGASDIEMDQMVVNFSLLPDLKWSDGTPLTVDDSVYAYRLASDPNTTGSKFIFDRTDSYEATSDLSLQWWGKPGFIDPTYFSNFWAPAPKHIWEQFTAVELPQIDVAAHSPLGWGPYVVQEWVPGDHIRLTKNIFYFRADQGLPKFDSLVFRFIQDPNAAISSLIGGACDILEPSVGLDSQIGLLLEMQKSHQLQAIFSTSMDVERLDFGIKPAAYDDPNDLTARSQHLDILGDKRTRQAIAMCLDRQKVVDTVLYSLSAVPDSFIPSDHPLYDPDVRSYTFDPEAADKLLEQVGWRDLDQNPATPRQALNVLGIPNDTPLVLDYLTTSTLQRRQVSEALSQSLAQCGIGVNLRYLSPAEFYAEGPAGPLFGRSFYLVQYAMVSNSVEPPCSWFMSTEVPEEGNQWVGTNPSGYSNTAYDTACQQAMASLPGEPGYRDGFMTAQTIFAEELPSVPLYLRLKVAAARPDFCNFKLGPTDSSPLWGIEAFDYGEGCNP